LASSELIGECLCVFHAENSKVNFFLILAPAIVVISAVVLLSTYGYIGSSGVRVSRGHGLKVTPSAHNFVCGGDAWMHWFADSGVVSAFVMSNNDLPAFLN